MRIKTKHWILLAIVNFALVALLGFMMRLKTIMPLTWLNQKHLLHAHSHFAFSGWVSHALMLLVLLLFLPAVGSGRKRQALILANLLAAYGMLVSFTLQGYGFYSIAIATFSILVSYLFSVYVWRRCGLAEAGSGVVTESGGPAGDRLPTQWIRASLVFLVLSSLGTFALSYLMMNHNLDSRKQLASVYFYLHFQYNGWFFYACMGLFHHWLSRQGIVLKRSRTLFRVFVVSCIPTYFLSVLWWKYMPDWLYWLVVVLGLAQFLTWIWWFIGFFAKMPVLRAVTSRLVRFLLLVVGLSVTAKLTLQALSLIPELSQYAYGFRPIVIGYLHLVLLVVVSLFLLAFLFMNGYLSENRLSRTAVIIAVSGILLNELLLMLQGLSGMLRIYINYFPQALTIAAATILIGLLVLVAGYLRQNSAVGEESR